MDQSRQGTTTTLLSRARRCFNILLGLMGLSLCLQVIGLATPGWIVQKRGPVDIHMGLWTVRGCNLDDCQSMSLDKLDPNGVVSDGLTEYRVETCLGMVTIFLAIVAGALSRRPQWLKQTAFSVILLSLISGILALVASGKIADNTRKAHDLWTQFVSKDSPFRFPYSVFLTGMGGIFACIVCLVGLFGVRPFASDPPQQAYPMSSGPTVLHATQTHYGQPYTGQPFMVQSNQSNAYPPNAYPSQPSAPHSGYTGQPSPGTYPEIQKHA